MKRIVYILTILTIVIIAGCQPTPEVSPVVYRGDGLPKDCIVPVLATDAIKEIDMPEEWREETEIANGWALVTADISLDKPHIGNTPVYEYAQKPLSDEDLKSLVRYFTGESKLYKYPELNKEELDFQTEQIINKKGVLYSPARNYYRATYLARMDGFMETANDKIVKEYIQPQFGYPTENQYLYFRTGEHQNLAETEMYYFNALVESDGEYDTQIKASTYNANAGSSSFFVYQKGAYISDNDIDRMYLAYETFKGTEDDIVLPMSIEDQLMLKDNWKRVKDYVDQAEDPSDTTKALADKTLKDLNITHLSCVAVTKCIALNISPRRWDMTFDNKTASIAYAYTYRVSIDDNLTCYAPYRTSGLPDNYNTPEAVYRPPCGTEQLTVIIADDDVYAFIWTNISERKGMLAANTKILPFDECKEKALNHMGYIVANELGTTPADAVKHYLYCFDATSVALQYYNITAYEKPDHVWTVPVYVFIFDVYLPGYDSQGQQDSKDLVYRTNVLINALDGGFISVEDDILNIMLI